MKRLCILFILFLSYNTFGQEKEPKPVKFKLGVVYSPDYSYRLLKPEPNYQWLKDTRNEEELPQWGYTTGLSVVYFFKKGLGMETGVYYAKRGEQSKVVDVSYLHFSSFLSYQYNYTFQYLGIPVKFTYQLSRKRINYFMNAGIGIELMQKAEGEITNNFVDHSETTNFVYERKSYELANFSAIVGLGISYKILENLGVSVEPSYTQLFTAVFPKDSVKEYPFSIGARVGVHYLFY